MTVRDFEVPMGVRAAEAIMQEQREYEARIMAEGETKLSARVRSAERILAAGLVERAGSTYYVQSETTPGTSYRTGVVDGVPTCTCPFFVERKVPCKHLLATAMHAQRESSFMRRPTRAELRREKANFPTRFCPDPTCLHRIDRISGAIPCPTHQPMLGPFRSDLSFTEVSSAIVEGTRCSECGGTTGSENVGTYRHPRYVDGTCTCAKAGAV